MPHTADQYQIPFSGVTPQSRQNSYLAAIAQRSTRGAKKCRMLAYIREHGLVTDQGLEEALNLPMQSICSLRNALCSQGFIRQVDKVMGKYGHWISVYAPVEMTGREEGW
jgi:transcription initiation factor IIE alpha subunit